MVDEEILEDDIPGIEGVLTDDALLEEEVLEGGFEEVLEEDLEEVSERFSNFRIAARPSRQNLVAEDPMRPRDRVTENREAPVPGLKALPLPERLLVARRRQIGKVDTIQRRQPG